MMCWLHCPEAGDEHVSLFDVTVISSPGDHYVSWWCQREHLHQTPLRVEQLIDLRLRGAEMVRATGETDR